MKPNKENDKCSYCNKEIGVIPISDNSGNQYWICENCDSELYTGIPLLKRIKKEIQKQINFHIQENNVYAINSLVYLKEMIKNEL